MKVLGIVGMPGSGKGEFSAIAAGLQIPVIVMGDVIRSEVEKAGLPPVDSSMGIVARQLRERDGMAAIAKACIPFVESAGADVVLIDGIRGDAEVREFAAHFPGFRLISIESPLETRFNRLAARLRSDDVDGIAGLSSRDERESSFGLRDAMALADFRIENTGTLDEFRTRVRVLLEELAGVA